MTSYETRLLKVEALLQTSPQNASLISLREDLKKMIMLESSKAKTDKKMNESVTKEVTEFRKDSTTNNPSNSIVTSLVDLSEHTEGDIEPKSESIKKVTDVSSSSWAVISSNETNFAASSLSSWQTTSTSSLSVHALPQQLTISTSSGVARLGSRIEGQLSVSYSISDALNTSNVWYPGVVTAVAANGTVTVRFIGAPTGTSQTVTFSDPSRQLRALEPSPNPPSDSDLQSGALFNAKYALDGKWYEARIDEVFSDSVKVTFTGYGNSEILPREYLCRMPQQSLLKTGIIQGNSEGSGYSKVAEISGSNRTSSSSSIVTGVDDVVDEGEGTVGQYEGLIIPENLRLLPTDTESERLRKRKRVKSLKQAWKEKKEADLGQKKANGWQNFTAKRQKL
jgi:hypothetical protein